MRRLVLGSVLVLACGGGQATSPSIAITPASATLPPGGTQPFTVIGTCPDGSALSLTFQVGLPPEERGRERSQFADAGQVMPGDVPTPSSGGRSAGEEQFGPTPRL